MCEYFGFSSADRRFWKTRLAGYLPMNPKAVAAVVAVKETAVAVAIKVAKVPPVFAVPVYLDGTPIAWNGPIAVSLVDDDFSRRRDRTNGCVIGGSSRLRRR